MDHFHHCLGLVKLFSGCDTVISLYEFSVVGIRQYFQEVEYHPLPQLMFDYKVTALVNVLASVTFNQCLVFSNFQMR